MYGMHEGKSMYFASHTVAAVMSFFFPKVRRRSRMSRVKFFVSSGEEEMPADD